MAHIAASRQLIQAAKLLLVPIASVDVTNACRHSKKVWDTGSFYRLLCSSACFTDQAKVQLLVSIFDVDVTKPVA